MKSERPHAEDCVPVESSPLQVVGTKERHDALAPESLNGISPDGDDAGVTNGDVKHLEMQSNAVIPARGRQKKQKLVRRSPLSFLMIVVILFSAMTGLLMGYDLCIIAVILQPITDAFNTCPTSSAEPAAFPPLGTTTLAQSPVSARHAATAAAADGARRQLSIRPCNLAVSGVPLTRRRKLEAINDVVVDQDDLPSSFNNDEAYHSCGAKQLFVSVVSPGAAIGSLLAGFVADVSGRKLTLALSDALIMAGTLMMALSHAFSLVVVGRCIVGFGIGTGFVIFSTYVSEISPDDRRGQLVSCQEVAQCVGCLMAYAIAAVSDANSGWRAMLLAAGIVAALQVCGILLLPESPRWLMRKNSYERAEQALRRLAGLPKQRTLEATTSDDDASPAVMALERLATETMQRMIDEIQTEKDRHFGSKQRKSSEASSCVFPLQRECHSWSPDATALAGKSIFEGAKKTFEGESLQPGASPEKGDRLGSNDLSDYSVFFRPFGGQPQVLSKASTQYYESDAVAVDEEEDDVTPEPSDMKPDITFEVAAPAVVLVGSPAGSTPVPEGGGLSSPFYVQHEDNDMETPSWCRRLYDQCRMTLALCTAYWWPICIAVGCAACQNFTASTAILYYSAEIFSLAGVQNPFLAGTGIGLAKVTGIILVIVFVERFGRKRFLLLGSFGTLLCHVAFVVSFTLRSSLPLSSLGSRIAPAIAVVAMILYMFFQNISWAGLMFVVASEVLPSSVRGVGMGLTITCFWVLAFLTQSTLETLMESITIPGVFLFYAGTNVIAILFTWRFIPELSGKSLEEITQAFS